MAKNYNYPHIIGIDEAGRGPLAGPLVVAGVRIKKAKCKIKNVMLGKLKDSKKLSAKKREKWFEFFANHPHIVFAVAKISPKIIDKINIARAANMGACRVYKKLAGDNSYSALLDGSLYLPSHLPHQTIIKGDEKIPVIAAASIIAKVTRDRIMLRLHKKYPQYGFNRHKGYGTVLHRACIKKFGRSEIHRTSFKLI